MKETLEGVEEGSHRVIGVVIEACHGSSAKDISEGVYEQLTVETEAVALDRDPVVLSHTLAELGVAKSESVTSQSDEHRVDVRVDREKPKRRGACKLRTRTPR